MTLQLNSHPKLLGLALQPDPLKLGSCKFNIIINIKIIIIIIIMNIANIIINKFEKNIISYGFFFCFFIFN
jgi:hypothetical protein